MEHYALSCQLSQCSPPSSELGYGLLELPNHKWQQCSEHILRNHTLPLLLAPRHHCVGLLQLPHQQQHQQCTP